MKKELRIYGPITVIELRHAEERRRSFLLGSPGLSGSDHSGPGPMTIVQMLTRLSRHEHDGKGIAAGIMHPSG